MLGGLSFSTNYTLKLLAVSDPPGAGPLFMGEPVVWREATGDPGVPEPPTNLRPFDEVSLLLLCGVENQLLL
jgi:hypothetical protein